MSFNFDRRTFLKGAGAVGAASLLAACGEKSNNTGNGAAASGAAAPNSTGATPLKEFISFESGNRELESWNMLYTQKAEDANVVTNLWDGLLSFDRYGKVVPAIASSWEHNEDATVWTFHLRDDVDWVDCNGEVKAHLTSKDFLVGFEWVMNAIKNEANNTSMPNDTIVGAYEYYALTKEAGDAAADMTYEDMLAAGVGIEAPDDYTLVFTCPSACPYFDTVAAYNSFYPVAPALIEELGVDGFRSCDNTTMWYNGPYVVEEYIQGNTKSYIPNPNYYDAANVSRFERFTVTMISDGSISLQLYQNRELDEVDLGESNITTIQSDPSNEYNQQLCEKRAKKFSYCFIFNYDKKNTDGTPDENWNKAIANKAFRQCFSKGMVLNKFFARYNPINPLKCENDFFTMKGLCYTSDGTDYTNLVAREMGLDGEAYDGKTMKRLRANNGDITELKKQAMEELSAIGVTFPVHCSYYILAGSTSALDSATVLKQCFTDSFGDDFIVLDVNTFVSSTMKEVVAPKLQSFVHMGWGADFGDPINFLTQIIVHDDNAYYSCNMTNIAGIVNNGPASYQKDLVAAYEKFTDLVNEGRAIVDDTDARYAAFAKAEAYFLDENLIFPTVYDITWCLTHVNEYSKINAMYGPCNYKAVNWETSEEAYTTEQYDAFAAAFDAATQA
ncbi:Tat pathway signal sequence [Faecalibacterium duncaniae]|jgi:oligopeptide transport system substrate-binding protein|uniref:Tat pathway signal sequence domain protein n=1 Tax=Faecalibacterium duncaniae (strain DSM 17677 / JCM 31915 / A2-165) TaxID=411483 RepID=C7H512_FAED2|nr:ABC transporter substrate-binding protein [Faecalibacterium duncaniae]ATO99069.1 Tat pathway signal sequence [Faecalibacterium duncaniae]EEU97024.1 Tat pathway signal sequence domain protein [Faecalibacterium duncaniae]MDV5055633.1 ABC transporter substrate-binding protein [Faecalibacterium duncaniae]QIA42535.1 Tat pathway signal sequence [Faecalibacterium duncaniae]